MKNSSNLLDEFKEYFDQELKINLPVLILPDNSVIYKNYLIKFLKNKNWGIFSTKNGDLIDQYYFKICALIAARAYEQLNFNKFNEIKRLDNQYWSNYFNVMNLKNKIKITKDYDRYLILIDKLEHNNYNIEYCKNKIVKSFRCTFA